MPGLNSWKTWAFQDVATSADLDAYIRDNGRWLSHNATNGAPMCRIANSGAQATTTGVDFPLLFDTERFDVGAMHDPVTNTSRITCPASSGGKYMIGAHVEWQSNGTGNRQIYIRLNGATILGVTNGAAVSTFCHQSVSTLYALAPTDYVEVVVNQTSGGALNVQAAAAFSPEFWAIWMGE